MLTDQNGMGTTMLVSPTGGFYGNNGGCGFGGDWGWIILLLLFAGGGWGNGFGGGFGGFGGMFEFPWLMSGQQGINANTNNGFQNALLNDNITSVRDGISDLSTQLCGGFAGVTAAVTGAQNAVSQQLYTNQIADLERSYNAQTATTQGMNAIGMSLQNCCCENRANIADLKYTVATENCADRQVVSDGIRDVIANQTANTQSILDKLCALELDGYKRENDQLRTQLNMASLNASQTAQNAFIQKGFSDEVDALYNRLNNCPVPTTPVYGRTPIFTCNQNQGCGCACGQF